MPNRYPTVIGIWVVLALLFATPLGAVTRLDTAFGLNGRVAVELGDKNRGHAVLVQSDGKIVVAGSSSNKNGFNFSLLRFNTNGSLDTSFNGEGSVITSLSSGDDEALALGQLSNGRIIAAGYSHNGKDRDLALACYRQDGSLDRNFGDRGVVLTSIGNGNEEITALTIGPADMITVAGSTEGTVGRVVVLARFLANGEPDTAFGEQGVSLIGIGTDASAEGILERDDGSYVVSGSYEENKKFSAMLLGVRSDGTVDTDFGDKGVSVPAGKLTASEGYGLASDGDGLMYLAGAVGVPGARDTALFRFTRSGKADPAFGDQGAVVRQISKEDDVLYDVDVGKNGGVVASGFTTDAGTRQFVLNTYLQEKAGTTTSVSGSSVSVGSGEDVSDQSPVQEVRVNGNTRVLIRRLQVWSNEVQIQELQILDALFDKPSAWHKTETSPSGVMPLEPGNIFNGNGSGVIGWFDRTGEHIEEFFLPTAHAAGAVWPLNEDASSSQSVTTSFSEGESVSYAVTTDEDGNIVVVGTADGDGTSSIVAARFIAEELIDRITDKPGQRSSHITTAVPADITKTTIITGGEIADAFGKEVVRRGVVFSVLPGPVYTGQSGGSGTSALSSLNRNIASLPLFFLPEAVAADLSASRLSGSTSRKSHDLNQFVSHGETDNGKGAGGYQALLEALLPGTVYYLRAYALTSQGDVYYGNQVSVRTADACFIATASYGTLLHPCVGLLRDFRDTVLLRHGFGKWLVERYYLISPPVADIIADHPALRAVVRLALLPFVGVSWLALHLGLGMTLILVAGMMTGASWLVRRSPFRS
jgi:uncharacterized delta-60 repeat protein